MQGSYGFTIVNGLRPVEVVNAELRNKISALLEGK